MKKSSDKFPDWGKITMEPAGQPPEAEELSPNDTMIEQPGAFNQTEELSTPSDTITTADVNTRKDIAHTAKEEEKQRKALINKTIEKIANGAAITVILTLFASSVAMILGEDAQKPQKPQSALSSAAKSLKYTLIPFFPQKGPGEELNQKTNKLVTEWQNKSIKILKELQKNGADIDHLVKFMQNHASFPIIFKDKLIEESGITFNSNSTPLFKLYFLNKDQEHFQSGKIIPVNGSELYAATDFESDLWFGVKLIYELSRMYDRKLNPTRVGRSSRLEARSLEIEALKAWDYNQYKEMIEEGMLIYGNKGKDELIKHIKKFFGLGDPESASKEEINYGIKICAIAIATAKLEAEYELAKEKNENEAEEDNENDDFFLKPKTKTKAEKETEKQKKLAELLKKYEKNLDTIQRGIIKNL